MILQFLFIILLLFSSNINVNAEGNQYCSLKGIPLYGKVQFVSSFSNLKIKYVNAFPDIKVQFVSSFPKRCGQWQRVNSFPDFKVEIVDSFPDLTIKEVSSFPGMN